MGAPTSSSNVHGTYTRYCLDVHDSGSVLHGSGSSPGLWLLPGQPGAGRQALQRGWAQQQALQRGQGQAGQAQRQGQRQELQLGVAQLQSMEGVHQQVKGWQLYCL